MHGFELHEEEYRSERLDSSVLDGLSAHVVVLDGSGTIVAVNEAWRTFARSNGADLGRVCEGADYLEACDSAAGPNSEGAAAFAAGVREVLGGRKEHFEIEYPCHSPTERRWFVGRARRLPGAGSPRAVVAHEDVTDRRRHEEERARRRLAQAEAQARAHEQRRVARELHDRVAHTMVVAHQSLHLYEAFRGRDPKRAAEKLGLAKRMTAEAMRQTRDLSRALRGDEAGEDFRVALSELLSELVPPGLARELSVSGDEGAVSAEVREQLFLVLREAVRNAVSHSGAAKIGVSVVVEGETVVGIVEDDGRGFERKTTGAEESGGLAHMSERASLLGGICSVGSAPGEGTRVEVSLPVGGAGRPVR